MKQYLFILVLSVLVCGCSPSNPVRPTPKVATEFVMGIEEFYGEYYERVPRSVCALDLYSEGLTLDSANHISGTGTNLYVSDIFLKDSVLAEGKYTSDTTTESFTFLPGKDFEGNPTGIYRLQIEDAKVTGIVVFEQGTIEVKHWADSTDMVLTFPAGSAKKEYKAHFRGVLKRDDRRKNP